MSMQNVKNGTDQCSKLYNFFKDIHLSRFPQIFEIIKKHVVMPVSGKKIMLIFKPNGTFNCLSLTKWPVLVFLAKFCLQKVLQY